MTHHGPGLCSPSWPQPFQESQFDIFDWFVQSQSCLQYFLNHGQHSHPVQSVASLINIQLPFQKSPAVTSAASSLSEQPFVPLVPFVRRLIVTGFDSPAILHGFFGDDWPAGIGPIHEIERRNYLFAAKSDTWLKVKNSYDMIDGQSVPCLRPLQNVTEKEIQSAETSWSDWLAMQDWMLGPRAPPSATRGSGSDVKSEEDA